MIRPFEFSGEKILGSNKLSKSDRYDEDEHFMYFHKEDAKTQSATGLQGYQINTLEESENLNKEKETVKEVKMLEEEIHSKKAKSTRIYKIVTVFCSMVGVIILILFSAFSIKFYFIQEPLVYIDQVVLNVIPSSSHSFIKGKVILQGYNPNLQWMKINKLENFLVGVKDNEDMRFFNLTSKDYINLNEKNLTTIITPVELTEIEIDIDEDLSSYPSEDLNTINELLQFGFGEILVFMDMKIGWRNIPISKKQQIFTQRHS